jgi:hypothetical protein
MIRIEDFSSAVNRSAKVSVLEGAGVSWSVQSGGRFWLKARYEESSLRPEEKRRVMGEKAEAYSTAGCRGVARSMGRPGW